MDEQSKKDFQQRPAWIFITLIVGMIGIAPSFTEQVLDFFPNWSHQKKWINLFFTVVGFFLLYSVYWIDQQKIHDPVRMPDEYFIKKTKWLTWRQNWFKYYPFNVVTLKIIPLCVCWVISRFIDKGCKPYFFHLFDFPKYWKKYNYEQITDQFFKSMFRVYIGCLKQSYEIKLERDFRHVEVRWTNKDSSAFSESKNELYENIFSTDDLKHIKIFTWIFPFGLYWNVRRVIKKSFGKS